MSYILEALRKSETERKQGEIPDLGASVQVIHKPRKSGAMPLGWLAVLALLLNAGVLAWLFWPAPAQAPGSATSPESESLAASTAMAPETQIVSGSGPAKSSTAEMAPYTAVIDGSPEDLAVGPEPLLSPAPRAVEQQAALEQSAVDSRPERRAVDEDEGTASDPAVPPLGSMPVDFQRQVPDLIFNSHIFSSTAGARRVMINNEYLQEGQPFEGMVVEEITEDGVILSLQGKAFLISVVRNWNAPRP